MEENNHIIVNFQPFVAKQEILVYINGNCEKQIYVSVDRIVDSVPQLLDLFKGFFKDKNAGTESQDLDL